jgi:Uma2 family endonuclease
MGIDDTQLRGNRPEPPHKGGEGREAGDEGDCPNFRVSENGTVPFGAALLYAKELPRYNTDGWSGGWEALNMSLESLQVENRVILTSVAWSTFESLLAETDHRGTRFTYNQGYLEIMSPSEKHERLKTFLGHIVEMTAVEWSIPFRSSGSTTLKNALKRRGLEPDQCYYIANERRVRGRDEIDLRVDPPPDLAIEVDISASSLDQLSIYADLGVPEVWIYDGTTLKVHQLQSGGTYAQQPRSPSFPFLPLEAIEGFLARRNETDETTWIRSFRAWVKTLEG